MENEFLSLNEAAALLNLSTLDLLQQCADSKIKIAVAVKELPVISTENNREILYEGICYIDDAHLQHAVRYTLEDGYRPDIPGLGVFCEGAYLQIKSFMLWCDEIVDLRQYYDHRIEIGRLLVKRTDIETCFVQEESEKEQAAPSSPEPTRPERLIAEIKRRFWTVPPPEGHARPLRKNIVSFLMEEHHITEKEAVRIYQDSKPSGTSQGNTKASLKPYPMQD